MILIEALGTPRLAAREITARLSMFEGLGYFVAPMSKEQRRARIVVFVGALKGIPAPFTIGSFDDWFATMSRAPSPGDIGNGARSLMRRARERVKFLQPRTLPPRHDDPGLSPEKRASILRSVAAEYPEYCKGLRF